MIPDSLTDLLRKLCNEHAQNEEMFGSAYAQDWNGYIMRYKDGQLISPNALTRAFSQFIEKHGFKKVRYHDLRHPYVKHTTKNKSLQKQKSQTIKS